MAVVRASETRRIETPNAVMTTYASPTVGGASQALWRVEMAPGAHGPVHAMDGEQVWTVLDGAAVIVADPDRFEVTAGDTVVLAAGRTRQITADAEHGVVAVVTGPGGAVASGPDREPVVPPWIA